jgi:hypothetical protein
VEKIPIAYRRPTSCHIVVPGDQERGDLKPDIGFVFQIFERFKDRGELSRTQGLIEPFGERFEVDIGGIHGCEEFLACLTALPRAASGMVRRVDLGPMISIYSI